MTDVLDRMLQQMAGQAVTMQTPGREQSGYQHTEQLGPVSIGKPQRERQGAQAGRAEQAQTLSAPATPTAKEQALEAALKSLLEYGDNAGGGVRQYLVSKGHDHVAGMFATGCSEHSAAIQ